MADRAEYNSSISISRDSQMSIIPADSIVQLKSAKQKVNTGARDDY